MGVNECENANLNNCDAFSGICTNFDGGYNCSCPNGFEDENGDGSVCVDYNECIGEGDGNNCVRGTQCTNFPGSFECSCMTGFHNLHDTEDGDKRCNLIVDCHDGNSGGCSHLCAVPDGQGSIGGCYCPGSAWTLGEDELNCQPSDDAVLLTCDKNEMTIEVDSALFDAENYELSLSDENCKAVEGANGWNLTTALEDCGTTLEFGNGEVVFTQVVKARAGANGIIFGRPVDLEFTCTYQTEFETDSERITINEVTSTQGLQGDGDFSFNIQLYSDNSFTDKQSESDVITVGERVFFAIETTQLPSNLVFAVHNCTIHDASVNQEFHVIEESCPSSTISADMNMVSNSQLRVSYMSFAFVSSDAMEHEEELTCSIQVCEAGNSNSYCASAQTNC